jgi:anaerobic magnesium-protoporphyrin IX monomethyl ester cyclase
MNSVKDIDFTVVGEGEVTTVELIKSLGDGKNLEGVNGIAFRVEDGGIKLTQPRKLIKDLDLIPIPSREFIDFKKVRAGLPFGRRKPFSIMMTSRGCPHNCIYCSKPVFGGRYRHRSVGNIIEEIEYLISMEVKEIRFYDDVFTMIPKNTIKLCDELIKRRFDLIWSCGSRVDRISKEMLIRMKDAGCYHISYGVESGSQKVLDMAKRNMKVNQIKEAFKITREVGLEVSAFLMFGLPGETEETLEETSSLIKKIKPDFISASLVGIYPKTELYQIARNEKLIEDIDWCEFTDRKASPLAVGPMMQYIPKDLTQEKLDKFFKRFYLWYYLHPIRAYRILKLVKNHEMLFRGGKALLSYVLR